MLFWIHDVIRYQDRSVWWRPAHLMMTRKQRRKERMGWAPNNPVKNMFPVTRLPLIRSFLFPPTKPITGRDKTFNTKKSWRTFRYLKQYQAFGYEGIFRCFVIVGVCVRHKHMREHSYGRLENGKVHCN